MKCPNCQTDNVSDSRFCHNCATPLKDDREDFATVKTEQFQSFELTRGDIFADRYEVIEDLGEGGMGKVFRVFDQKIKEAVALKLIRPEIGVNSKAIERFRNELKIARKISHRNICRMFDLGEEGFLHYITMEYVPGEDLKRFVRRAGQLTSGKAIFIAKQVATGLAEAHRLGVIHRDLKPQNIMIDQDGNSRIMDFGIARFVDADKLTGSGVMIGTPEYMSPEQAELKEVDKRADIYALGVVLYEMVTGRVPFEGETPLSIAMKHKTAIPKNVREINISVSKELAAIISKCLEKDPQKRYQTAEELIEDLNGVERGLSTQERVVPKKAATAVRKIKTSLPLKKLLLPAAAVIVIVIAIVTVLKFMPVGDTSVESILTDQQATEEQIAESQGEQSLLEKEMIDKTSAPLPANKDTQSVKKAKSPVERRKGASKKPAKQPVISAPDLDESTAQLGIARLTAAKTRAQRKGLDEKILFYRVAVAKESEAQKYLTRKKYLESRSLSSVSEQLLLICINKKNDEDRFKALDKYIEGLRKKIDKADKIPQEIELYSYGIKYEKQGADFLTGKDYENSLKACTQAAAAFEKLLLILQSREAI